MGNFTIKDESTGRWRKRLASELGGEQLDTRRRLSREYYIKNKGKILEYHKRYMRKKMEDVTEREKRNLLAKDYVRKLRLQVIDLYGGKCSCCGESRVPFLAIDHIGGGGKGDRGRLNRDAGAWYRMIIKNRPSNLRLLCHNCNMAVCRGVCPHKADDGWFVFRGDLAKNRIQFCAG